MKEEFATEREELKAQIQKHFYETVDIKEEIENLNDQMEALKEHHMVELERKDEKALNEKNNALLELEREYQKKLTTANEEYANQIRKMNEAYTNQIQQLYEQMNRLREK
ncbi:recombination and DNA strand exchange inhibitor protein [Bacillus cereus m1293]|nr:recombination and DNA strand exchange inhibitor protein [Bacillus cereus m1293]